MINEILAQLGTTTVVIAIAGFIFKIWISHYFENLVKKSEHQLAIKLESVKADWAKDVAKLNVHEEYLHKKRVDLIEALYSKMLEAEFSLQNFLLAWWAESNKENLKSRYENQKVEFSMARGVEFCEKYTEINAILHKNALYFDNVFIQKITESYKPIFETIMSFDDNNIPAFPEKFKDIITAGQEPRSSVIALFREMLGVEFDPKV